MITGIHHINFIVKNLEEAVEKYARLPGLETFEMDVLPARGVRTARVRVGETWLILVEPENLDSVPGRYLRQHGEGFFLLSFASDDFDADCESVVTSGGERRGLDHWRIQDLDPGNYCKVQLQLTEKSEKLR